MGSITGTILAAFGLTYLQEWLRFLGDYRMVIYPLLMILMMLFRPQGLMGGREWTLETFIRKKISDSKVGNHG
jgi:branched-chain amino acid transport system permease protein